MASHFKKSSFLSTEEAQKYFDILSATVQWKVFPYAPNSRMVCKYHRYTNEAVEKLIEKVSAAYQINVIGVFMNVYQNGNDYCPYHADKYGTDVYTISLGGTRDLLIKPNQKGTKAEKIKLESGDLYYMAERLHSTHKHSVPKRKNAYKRISVVFFAYPD